MPIIQPPKPRHKFEDLGDTLRFTIPNPKSGPGIVFLLIWLLPWVLLLIGYIAHLISPATVKFEDPPSGWWGALCLIPYFGFWVGIPLYGLLWQLTGKEIVEFTPRSIRMRWPVVGLGWSKEYPRQEALNVQLKPTVDARQIRLHALFSLGRNYPALAFQYNKKSVYFGNFLEEAELKQILGVIRQRFPVYGRTSDSTLDTLPPSENKTRVSIEEAKDSLKITIRTKRRWLKIMGSGLYSIMLVGMSVFVFRAFIFPYLSQRSLIEQVNPISLILVAWLVASVSLLINALWEGVGMEIIYINAQTVSIQHSLLGFTLWSQEFLAKNVDDLRVGGPSHENDFFYTWFGAFRTLSGPLAFDYGTKTIRFGNYLDENEANRIVAAILHRFPEFQQVCPKNDLSLPHRFQPRSSIDISETGINIAIPVVKNFFIIAFACVWLIVSIALLIISTSLLFTLLSRPIELPPKPAIMILPAIVFSILFIISIFWGGMAAWMTLWALIGKETIEINSHFMVVSSQISIISRSKKYVADYIKEIRASPFPPIRSKHPGAIAFDYGARTFQFGIEIDEAEARQIVAAIQERFPQYR